MKIKLTYLFNLISKEYSNVTQDEVYNDIYFKLLHRYQGMSKHPIQIKGTFQNNKDYHPFIDEEIDYSGILVYYENFDTKQWIIEEFENRQKAENFLIDSLYKLYIHHPYTTIIENNSVVDYDIYAIRNYEVGLGNDTSEIRTLNTHGLQYGKYYTSSHKTHASSFKASELKIDWEYNYDDKDGIYYS